MSSILRILCKGERPRCDICLECSRRGCKYDGLSVERKLARAPGGKQPKRQRSKQVLRENFIDCSNEHDENEDVQQLQNPRLLSEGSEYSAQDEEKKCFLQKKRRMVAKASVVNAVNDEQLDPLLTVS